MGEGPEEIRAAVDDETGGHHIVKMCCIIPSLYFNLYHSSNNRHAWSEIDNNRNALGLGMANDAQTASGLL